MAKRKSKKQEIKFSSEDEMLPHSEAKIALYGRYIEKYLAILGVVPFITKINIFDIFCGIGIYKNGKYGSPIVAYKAIKITRDFLKKINFTSKPTTLFINDGNPVSLQKVSTYLSSLNEEDKCCDLIYENLDARNMLDKSIKYLKTQDLSARSLVFIDPTGYKDIHKVDLVSFLNLKCEIIIFLPVSFMYRFKGIVQKDFDNPSYVHLRRFINEFFSEDHPIRKELPMDVFIFIKYLEEVFKFDNKFYSTTFFLQRSAVNYYALFFITSSILGLERVIDAKWEIDKESGEGFIYEEEFRGQLSLFSEFKPVCISNKKLLDLEIKMREFIGKSELCNNQNLTEYILLNNYKISHANQIIKKWKNESLIEVLDIENNKVAPKIATYLGNKYFKSIKATFKLL